MKDRPILFSAPMVKAILEGRKTQTRRIVKPQLEMVRFVSGEVETPAFTGKLCAPGFKAVGINVFNTPGNSAMVKCPYGKPGDRLWVRETFQFVQANSDGQRNTFKAYSKFTVNDYRWIEYAATPRSDEPAPAWKPSIFMPHWASRITLEITEVRVQRLQEISEEDAKAEGCESIESERDEPDFSICPNCGGTGLFTGAGQNGGAIPDVDCGRCDTYVKRYRHLWESINGKGSWDKNPYVWAITFKKL